MNTRDAAGLRPLHLWASAVLVAALIAYASLAPFSGTTVGWRQAWHAVLRTWPPVIQSKSDFLSNVLLQMPLGFLLAGALALDRPARRAAAILLAVLACGTLALAIEVAQVSVSNRTPQLVDVLAELVGGGAGAIVWSSLGQQVGGVLRAWLRSPAGREGRGFAGYAIAWVLAQWIPFDFTIRLAELAAKYRGGLVTLLPHAPRAFEAAAVGAALVRSWLIAVPLGGLAWLLVPPGLRHRRMLAASVGLAATFATFVAQLLVLSRGSSAADGAAAMAGMLAGLTWLSAMDEGRLAVARAVAGGVSVAFAAVLGALLLVAGGARVTWSAAAPFAGYDPRVSSDALGSALLTLEAGIAAGLVLGGTVTVGRRIAAALLGVPALLALAAVATSSTTHALQLVGAGLACVGGVLGLSAGRRIRNEAAQ